MREAQHSISRWEGIIVFLLSNGPKPQRGEERGQKLPSRKRGSHTGKLMGVCPCSSDHARVFVYTLTLLSITSFPCITCISPFVHPGQGRL